MVFARTAVLILFVIVAATCSVPTLEQPECAGARDAVKRFYSFHFGNDMHPSPENLRARAHFLTPSLVATLSERPASRVDDFTATDDQPKAFRVGECRVLSPDRTQLQVLLLWRDDVRNEQKEISVETVNAGDGWLIDKIEKR